MILHGLRHLFTGALALLFCGSALASTAPETIFSRLRDSQLDISEAVQVNNLRLDTGMAELILEKGTLYPATPLTDHSSEVVFIGRGRLILDPPDEIEASQLDLFTGSHRLNTRFTEAVFAVARAAASNAILDREPVAGTFANNPERALWLYDQWKTGTIRRLANVESSLFLDALGDPSYDNYFAAWFGGSTLGEFYYVVDPTASEQVTLGQFVPIDLTQREQYKYSLETRFQKSQGRLNAVNTEDLGRFDTWLSASLLDDEGVPFTGSQGLEPTLYALDVGIAKGSQRVTGRAHIHLKCSSGPRNAIRLSMSTDLGINKILDSGGNELFFVRYGSSITVPLVEPLETGEKAELIVEYQGNPLEQYGKGSWSLRDTAQWYPHVGEMDRARYDVTFHWPRALELFASGHHVDGGVDESGMRWEHRVMDLPIDEFSFEIGEYKTTTTQVGEITVRVAFSKDMVRRWDQSVLNSVNTTVVNSLEFFQEKFGPLPLKELTVVAVDRNFSQGFFGFLTLSKYQIYYGKPGSRFGFEDRRIITSHEVAHQWWGNLVGWASYRDQWISEAMANYSAMLYSREKLDLTRTKLRGPTSGWSQALARTTEDGRTIESIGPVTLGHRLSSTKAPDAYLSIIYLKGAMILDMLAQYFHNEELFPTLMKEVVKAAGNHAISSEDFMAAIGKLTGVDLDWFTKQYILGTGIPDVFYSYEFQELEDGKWAIAGVARQDSVYRYQYSIVETDQGQLDAHRTKIEHQDITGSTLVAPVRIRAVGEDIPDTKKKKKSSAPQKNREFKARFLIKGEETPFRFEVPAEPALFWLDKEKQTLARFYDDSFFPKGSLMNKATRLLSDADYSGAEKTLQKALRSSLRADTPDTPKDAPKFLRQALEKDSDDKNAKIHLYLARLYLDTGQVDLAEAEVMAAEKILDVRQQERFQTWLTRTTARIEILRGQYEPAFKRLNKSLLVKEDSNSTEGFLLLAIAAKALGKDQVMKEAIAAARDKGADVALLTRSGS